MNMAKKGGQGDGGAGAGGNNGGASALAGAAGSAGESSGLAAKAPAITGASEPTAIMPRTKRKRQEPGEADGANMPDFGKRPKPDDYEWDEGDDGAESSGGDDDGGEDDDGEEEAGKSADSADSADSDGADDDAEEGAGEGKPVDAGKKKTGEIGEISDELLERAIDAGLSIAEAREHGDAASLERTLKILERRSGGDQGDRGDQGDKAQAKAGEKEMTEADLLKWDEDFDERMIGKFKDLHNYHTKRYSALESKLAEVSSYLQAQRVAEVERDIEGRFDALDKGYEPLFGKGSSAELDRNSKLYKNRAKVVTEMNTIALGLRAQKKPVPPTQVLFERALRSVFGDQAENIARGKVVQQARDKAGQFTNRPSSTRRRHEPGSTPEQRAKAAVERVLAAKGLSSGSTGPSDDETDGI